MFGFNMYALIAMGVFIAALMAGIYVQKKWNDEAIAKKDILISELQVSVVVEKTARKIAEFNIKFLKESADIQRDEREKLSNRLLVAEQAKTALEKKFDRHDLEALSRGKPKLIESIINKGTQAVFDDFERITKPR